MANNIMLTVGLGERGTIITGIIADGNVVCNIVMSKQQAQDHIALLQRHVDAIPNEEFVHEIRGNA